MWHKTKKDIYICTCCGREAYWDTDYGQQLFDYCPYCGMNHRDGMFTIRYGNDRTITAEKLEELKKKYSIEGEGA